MSFDHYLCMDCKGISIIMHEFCLFAVFLQQNYGLKRDIQDFHMNYVLVPAANTVVVV